jgi:hypothetical protein
MTHNGDLSPYDRLNCIRNNGATLQFYRTDPSLLNEPPRISDCIVWRDLIGQKGHITNHESPIHSSRYAGAMIGHLIHRYRQGSRFALHY